MSLGCIAVSECTYERQLPLATINQPTHPHPDSRTPRDRQECTQLRGPKLCHSNRSLQLDPCVGLWRRLHFEIRGIQDIPRISHAIWENMEAEGSDA
jgi:hypothetical protein